ncbi:hypothetical protein R1flu_010761 [Riccia fluitans]|uniref:Ion transport domain-containing protein n=1 Tax=Riccia fluitans TaxID=41844 RepID=A0ABD1Z8D5_9MARC
MIVIFGAELLLRFLAGGFSGFVEERINVIDFVVVVISAFNTGQKRPFANITPIRLLRWFYVKRSRRVHRGGESVPILASILRSVEHLLAVYGFLSLVVFIFSVFSMELWGGEMYFEDGYPRANHDSLGQAMLLWFTVTTGESWVNFMWDAMRPGVKNRWAAPYIFVLYYIITSIIVLNLIIATILEETELTDKQKKYIQKKEHLKWLQTKHYHHLSSTRHSDWIIDAVEGAQKSYMDVKRRMTSMKVSRLSLFPSSRSLTPDAEISKQQQQKDESMETETKSSTTTTDGQPTVPPEAPRRSSYSDPAIPGSTQTDGTTTGGPVRRTSASGEMPAAASDSSQALPRRRGSLELDPLMVRSGFTNPSLVQGGVKTALQSALVAVVDEQAKVASVKATEGKAQPSNTTPTLGRTASGRKVSFVLSEFDTSPTFVVRAIPWWMNDRSLFLFGPNNVVRIYITKFVEHKVYNLYVWTTLGLGLAILPFNTNNGDLYDGIHQYVVTPWRVERAYTFFTCLDIVLRSIAYGVLFTRESFLSDPYNIFDMLNALFAILRTIYFPKWWEHGWTEGLKYMKWNKVGSYVVLFRPLLIIGRFMGLRRLMSNVIRTMPVLGQLFLFIFAVYAIFAVLGIQLYANRFRFCSDPSVIGHNDCVGVFRNEMGILAMRTWVNPNYHFDTFADALLALFVGSTFDSWTDNFLYPAMDLAHKQELQPVRNRSPSHAIFFVSFMCVGGIFILRMFVGVFIDQFGIMSGSKLMTERQQLWRDANRLIQGLKPKVVPSIPSFNPVRRFCFRLVYSRKFELTVVFVIVVNFLYMTTRHVNSDNDIPEDMNDDGGVNAAVETMFVCLYGLEVAMKLLGTRIRQWWDDKWNVAELCMFIISASCLYPELITYAPSNAIPNLGKKEFRPIPDFPGIPGILLLKYPARQFLGAAFIFIRIFRVIRYFKGLQIMVTTIMIALPTMIDTMALMFVWLIFLTMFGPLVFGDIKSGNCITRTIGPNFETPTRSFSVMMQLLTLDNWSCLLKDMTVQPPMCNTGSLTGLLSDCGKPIGGLLFIMVTIILTTYIFANIFVAQILDTVTFGLIHEKNLLAPEHIMAFQAQWSQPKYDPKYTKIEFEVQHFRDEKGIGFRPLLETVCLYKVGPRGLELPVRIERERQIQSIYQKGAAYRIQALIRGFLQRRRNRRARAGGSQKTTDDQGEDRQRSEAKQEQQYPPSSTPSASSTSMGWATASSTSGWASAASDTHSDEKTPAESSAASDDEETGARTVAAASSVYETPTSTTPTNEPDRDLQSEIEPAEEP